jgi:hypothetical protein
MDGVERKSFGVRTNSDGDPEVRGQPFDWLAALPGSGDFIGHLVYLTAGSVGWYYWNGSAWVGPLGAGGGGGGAPTGASYVTLGLDATLTSERVLTAGAAISLTDSGANGTITVAVPDAGITDAKLRNSAGRSVIGRTAAAAGVPADIIANNGTDHVLREAFGVIGFGQVLNGGIADNAVTTAKISNNQVTNAKLADMNDQTIKGRNAGFPGAPQDLTVSQVRSLLSVAATPTGTGFVHITTGTQDAAAKLVDTADINDGQVTDQKLRNSSALSVIGRTANSTGVPADIVATVDGQLLVRSGTTLVFGQALTAGIADDQITNAKLANMANGTHKARISAGTGDPEDIPFAGTVFPTSPAPIDGQMFYRTDHKTMYVRDSAKAAWLSVDVHELEYGDTGAVAAGAYFRFGQNTGFIKYSATVGHIFGFPVICVGLTWRSSVAPASAITLAVTGGGAVITGATMAVGQQKKTREDLASNTISTESVIGFQNSSANTTGNMTMNGRGRFRRIET